MTFIDIAKYEILTATVKNWSGIANDEKREPSYTVGGNAN